MKRAIVATFLSLVATGTLAQERGPTLAACVAYADATSTYEAELEAEQSNPLVVANQRYRAAMKAARDAVKPALEAAERRYHDRLAAARDALGEAEREVFARLSPVYKRELAAAQTYEEEKAARTAHGQRLEVAQRSLMEQHTAAVRRAEIQRRNEIHEARAPIREVETTGKAERDAAFQQLNTPVEARIAEVNARRDEAYEAIYIDDVGTADEGRSETAATQLRERHRRLCDAVLWLPRPRLARKEVSPGLERCLGYAEADAAHAKAHDASKARFNAARIAIFVEHYPEFANAPTAHRHLFGSRARAFNEAVDDRARRPFQAAKRAANAARNAVYDRVYETSNPPTATNPAIAKRLKRRHRILCKQIEGL